MIQCTSYISSFHTIFSMEKGSQSPLIIVIYMHALLQCIKYYGSSQCMKYYGSSQTQFPYYYFSLSNCSIIKRDVILQCGYILLFWHLCVFKCHDITSIWRLASLMIKFYLPWPFLFIFQNEALALIFIDIGDLKSACSAASVA